jgi:hypothetical protein
MLSAADFPDVFPWMAQRPPGPDHGIGAGRSPLGEAHSPSPVGRRRADDPLIVGSIDWPAPGVALPVPPALVVAALAMLRISSTALPGQTVELAFIQPLRRVRPDSRG